MLVCAFRGLSSEMQLCRDTYKSGPDLSIKTDNTEVCQNIATPNHGPN